MMEGAPAIVDIGNACQNPARFVSDSVRRRSNTVLEFASGSGLAIPDIDLLLIGDGGDASKVAYSVAMEINMRRTSCWVRLLNVNPASNDGLYLCESLNLRPTSAVGGPALRPKKWYHVVVTASAERGSVAFYVEGQKQYEGNLSATDWVRTMGIRSGGNAETRQATGASKLIDAPYMSFFNDCGKQCLCQGGIGNNAGGRVRSIQVRVCYSRLHPMPFAAVQARDFRFGR